MKKWLVVALALMFVLSILALLWRTSTDRLDTKAESGADTPKQVGSPATVPEQPGKSTEVVNETAYTDFEREAALARRGNASAALAAYTVAAKCRWARVRQQLRAEQRTSNSEKQPLEVAGRAGDKELLNYCRDLAEHQLNDRLTLLEIALREGVPGAAVMFFKEGPNGDLTALAQRPNDPLVSEWKRRAADALEKSAMNGDLEALATLGASYQFGQLTEPELEKALTLEVALLRLLPEDDAPRLASQRLVVESLTARLPEKNARQAETQGLELAARIERASEQQREGKR